MGRWLPKPTSHTVGPVTGDHNRSADLFVNVGTLRYKVVLTLATIATGYLTIDNVMAPFTGPAWLARPRAQSAQQGTRQSADPTGPPLRLGAMGPPLAHHWPATPLLMPTGPPLPDQRLGVESKPATSPARLRRAQHYVGQTLDRQNGRSWGSPSKDH